MVKGKQKKIAVALITISILIFIILAFVKIEFDKQGSFLCDAVAENPDMEMDECPVHTGNASWLLILAFAGSVLVFVTGVYLFMTKSIMMSAEKNETKKRSEKKRTYDTSKLSKEEKTIYNLLTKNDGSIYQSDIVKETEFSKVKITRLLDKLEGKGIIERKRRGMTNVVILK
jgi:uncharacterized membrane protein